MSMGMVMSGGLEKKMHALSLLREGCLITIIRHVTKQLINALFKHTFNREQY